MTGNEIHCHKPLQQRNLSVIEYRSHLAREIRVASSTFKSSISTSITMLMSTIWADYIVTPTIRGNELLTFSFRVEEKCQFIQ